MSGNLYIAQCCLLLYTCSLHFLFLLICRTIACQRPHVPVVRIFEVLREGILRSPKCAEEPSPSPAAAAPAARLLLVHARPRHCRPAYLAPSCIIPSPCMCLMRGLWEAGAIQMGRVRTVLCPYVNRDGADSANQKRKSLVDGSCI